MNLNFTLVEHGIGRQLYPYFNSRDLCAFRKINMNNTKEKYRNIGIIEKSKIFGHIFHELHGIRIKCYFTDNELQETNI